MQKVFLTVVTFSLLSIFPLPSHPYERTLGLTDKEILERLTRLEENYKGLNNRFDDVNNRFDDLNRRIDDLRSEMNARFDHINRRFEDINRRFEDINRRIDKLTDVMIGVVAAFAGLVVAMIGLVFWDRRTLIEKAVQKMEADSRLVNALRELAKEDRKLAEVMKSFGLL